MTSYTLFILLLFARVRVCENFKIGLLLTTRAPSPGFPTIFTSGGAFQLALEEINHRYKTSVDYIWNNTDCDVTRALLTGYEQGTQGNVDVIVGPACEKCKFI
jgi:hypothetical protein